MSSKSLPSSKGELYTLVTWANVYCFFDLTDASVFFFGSRVNEEEKSTFHPTFHPTFLAVAFVHKMA